MPTATKTWAFENDTQGLADQGNSATITFAWQSAYSQSGSGGCIKFTTTTKGTTSTEYAFNTSTGETWETWGVPANSAVTSIQMTAGYERLATATKSTSNTLAVRIINSSGTTVHSAGDLYDAVSLGNTVDGTWQSLGAGTARAVDASYQASTTDVRLRIDLTIVTGGSSSAAGVDQRLDEFTLTMTYSAAATPLTYNNLSEDQSGNLADAPQGKFIYQATSLADNSSLELTDNVGPMNRQIASFGSTTETNFLDSLNGLQRHYASFGSNAEPNFSDSLSATLAIVGQGLNDSLDSLLTDLAGVSDAVGVDDSTAALLRMLAGIGDGVPEGGGGLGGEFGDQVPFSDSLAALFPYLASLSESFSSADTALSLVRLYSNLASESVSLSDGVSDLLRILAQMYDDATLSADTLAALFRYLAQPTESLPLSDEASLLHRLYASTASESVSLTDDVSALLRLLALLTDAVSNTDDLSIMNRLVANLASDSVSLNDDLLALLRHLAQISDDFSSTLADAVVHTLVQLGGATPLSYPFGDDASLGLADNLTALHRLLAIATEALTWNDLAGALNRHLASASDATPSSDTVDALNRLLAQLSETLPLSDNAVLLMPMLAIASDALNLADLVSGIQSYRSEISDSIVLSDVIAAIQAQRGSISDATGMDDLVSALFRFLVSASDTFSPSDTLAAQFPYYAGVSEDLGLTDGFLGLLSHRILMGEDVGSLLADLVTITLILVGQATPLSYSFADDASAAFDDNLAGLMRDLAQASELLTYSDIAAAVGRINSAISDAATQADALALVAQLMGDISDVTGVTDGIGGRFVYKAQIGDSEAANLADRIVARLISMGIIDVNQRIRIGHFIDGFTHWSR